MVTENPDPPLVKGPLVWLDMDQWELDDAYDHARYAPNREYVLARYLANSGRARAILSGAHLGGCVVTTDWPARGLPADILKGAVLASGMYDLRPVRLSKRSAYLRLTDEVEAALSPIRHLDRLGLPLIVSYGSCETPEFQRQSVDFCRAVRAAGKPATLLVGEGYNHFELLETLGNPYGLLGRAALAQLGLGAPVQAGPGTLTQMGLGVQ